MRLQSCDNCGIVLDLSKISIPTEAEMYDKEGTVDNAKFLWSSGLRNYVPFIKCPCCNYDVLIED